MLDSVLVGFQMLPVLISRVLNGSKMGWVPATPPGAAEPECISSPRSAGLGGVNLVSSSGLLQMLPPPIHPMLSVDGAPRFHMPACPEGRTPPRVDDGRGVHGLVGEIGSQKAGSGEAIDIGSSKPGHSAPKRKNSQLKDIYQYLEIKLKYCSKLFCPFGKLQKPHSYTKIITKAVGIFDHVIMMLLLREKSKIQ